MDLASNALILGCPRSGTSIMGELFQHLPGWKYRYEGNSDLKALDSTEPLVWKNPKQSNKVPGLTVNPVELEALKRVPKVIWVVRHPLDAVLSLKTPIANGWNVLPRPHGWRGMTGTQLELAARQWLWVNDTGWYNLLDSNLEVCLVHYENMIARPGMVAWSLMEFLGAEADTTGAIAEWAATVTDDPSEHQAENQDVWRGSNTRRVGRWMDEMNEEIVDLVWGMCEETAQGFGYLMDGLELD